MARTLEGLLLPGRVVYRYGSPSSIGRIVRVIDKDLVEVFMIRTKEVKPLRKTMLRDYEALVEEVERKAKNHRNDFEAAKVAILPSVK